MESYQHAGARTRRADVRSACRLAQPASAARTGARAAAQGVAALLEALREAQTLAHLHLGNLRRTAKLDALCAELREGEGALKDVVW